MRDARKICVITGGAGFIGCALSRALVECFERVIAIDVLHPQVHSRPVRPEALDPRIEFVRGDVTDAAMWEQVLERTTPNVIIHLAAETGTGQSLIEATRHAKVNVVGTTTMLDALVKREKLPARIVLASSRAVYGEGAWVDQQSGAIAYPGQRSRAQLERGEWDFTGKRPLAFESGITYPAPTSIYAATKLAQEHIVAAWAASFGVELSIARLQNVYGPGQSLTNPYTGIVSLFVRLARDGRSIPVFEDGNIIRDFVFIEDVTSALKRLALDDVRSSLPYDIGSGAATTILDLAQLIARKYSAPEPHINLKFRHGDVRSASCNIERSKKELDWAPRWRLDEGISALCDWVERQLGSKCTTHRPSA